MIVLTGMSALLGTSWPIGRLVGALGRAIASVALLSLMTSCGSSRKVTSGSRENLATYWTERDSLREEIGQEMEENVTEREAVRVVKDTVVVERRDTVVVEKVWGQPPAENRRAPWLSALRWIFWIIVAIGGLVVLFQVSRFKFH